MIDCNNCGVSSIPGTLFCTECGAALYRSENADTHSLRWRQVHFMVSSSGRKQRTPLSAPEPIMIGRADPDNNYWPQLDLTDDGGVEHGVSRYHASIQSEPGGPVIIDQNSLNGTWIDEVRLKPQRPYSLPSSARVRFGSLYVHLFLE